MFGTWKIKIKRLTINFWCSFKLYNSEKTLGIIFAYVPYIHIRIGLELVFFGIDFYWNLKDR